MNVWKQMCRFVEDKKTVRRFGDMVELVDSCAIFEFTDDQIHRAREEVPRDLSVEEPYPIPPFPFPRMCMVGSGGIIIIQSPLMDEATGILEFEVMVFQPTARDPLFQQAVCVVDSTKADAVGRFPMKLRDHRGAWGVHYWEGDGPGNPFTEDAYYGRDEEDTQALRRQAAERVQEMDEKLEKARAAGHLREVAEIEKLREDLVRAQRQTAEMLDRLKQKTSELKNLGQEVIEEQRSTLNDAFYLALQEVNWINLPDHFTVQVEGPEAGGKRRKKQNRIRRLNERTRHIVLTRGEIGDAYRRAHGGGAHAPPIPHLRRGHYRTLRAERYKEKRGQVVWVRATHVAGHCVEWRDGDVRYKVV